MKRPTAITTLAAVLLAGGGYLVYNHWNSYEDLEFTPEPGTPLAEAYERLIDEPDDEHYDLEKTVAALVAMDRAQANESSDINTYLITVAQEIDLDGVAGDVLEAKAQLMPVIARMKRLDERLGDGTTWGLLAKTLGNGTMRLLTSDDTYQVMSSLYTGYDASASNFIDAFSPDRTIQQAVNLVTDNARATFSEFGQALQERDGIREELQRIQEEYIGYLEAFMPLYRKYMDQWNALCQQKDQIYLYLGEHDWENAAHQANLLLSDHPDNREALLLEALALANIGANNLRSDLRPIHFTVRNSDQLVLADSLESQADNIWLQAAQRDLDHYLELYGNAQSAPAHLIQGVIDMTRGRLEQARIDFKTASKEYPNQFKALSGMKDPYSYRTYLNHSQAGLRLMSLYHAMMYGYDFFSPDLHLAMLEEVGGRYDRACDNIYDHFHRRLSPEEGRREEQYYDILSDLEYCDHNLPISFGMQKMNPAFISIDYAPSIHDRYMGMSHYTAQDEAVITFSNNSDIALTDITIIPCYQFSGGHRDFYQTGAAIQINRMDGTGQNTTTQSLPVGHQFDQLAHFRAVVYTDQGICWIEAEQEHRRSLAESHNDSRQFLLTGNPLTPAFTTFLCDNGLSDEEITRTLQQNTDVSVSYEDRTLLDDAASIFGSETRKPRHITLQFDNRLALLRPTFSVSAIGSEGASAPRVTYEFGRVRVAFVLPADAPDTTSRSLFLYSDFGNYEIAVTISDDKGRVQRIARM